MTPDRTGRDREQWVENLFHPLVIALMVGCVAWSLIQFVRRFSPSWSATYLILACMLAALEANYAYRWLKSPQMRSANVLRFRFSELALILVFVKFSRYIGRSVADIVAEISMWPNEPFLLFDLETLAAFTLAFFCWGAATQTAGDLRRLSAPLERRRDYVSPVENLANRFLVGGAILLIAAGLTRFEDPSALLDLRRPLDWGIALNALIYFLLGVLMVSQVRYLELRRRWRGSDALVADDIARRWVRYSAALVGLAVLLAIVLPTAFTTDFLGTVTNALSDLGTVLSYLALLVFALLSLPFSILTWLLSILLPGGNQLPPPEPLLPEFEPVQQPDAAGATGWWEILRVLLFWGVLLAVFVFVIRSYLRGRPRLRVAVSRLRPIQALNAGWRGLRRRLRVWFVRLRRTVGERLPRRLPHPSPSTTSTFLPLHFFRLRALAPRERVLYYYLSVLRRADRQGYPRQRHQTPQEYQANLEPHLPQAGQDLSELTEAFVEARYSPHEVVPDQEQRVRASWERVKVALRALKG